MENKKREIGISLDEFDLVLLTNAMSLVCKHNGGLKEQSEHFVDLYLRLIRAIDWLKPSSVYTAENCVGAVVYDVDTKEKFKNVISVDTTKNVLVIARDPIRVSGGVIETFNVYYRSIYGISDRPGHPPVLFHCYGRK